MTSFPRSIPFAVALLAALALGATPARAQGKSHDAKRPAADPSKISVEFALSAVTEVLVAQGYKVVSIEKDGDRQVVTYRAGSQGRGKGLGPPVRMVIRRAGDRIVVDDTPDNLKLEIGIKLGIKL